MRNARAPLAGLGEFGQMLFRWSWFILASAIAGVVLATYLAPDATAHVATARIGLTDEVRWPFFNSTRQRIAGLADGIDPHDVVSNPEGLVSVEVSLPSSEAFLNVEAVASEPDVAVQAANEFAKLLIEIDSVDDPAADSVQTALDVTAAELDELSAAIAVIDDTHADLLTQLAEAEVRWLEVRIAEFGIEVQNEALIARNAIDLEVSQIAQERETLSRRLTSLEVEKDQLELQLITDAVGPAAVMIRPAVVDTEAAVPLRPRQLVGALTGAVLAGLAVWILSENFGRLRTAAGVHAVAGVAVIDARADRGLGRLAVWLNRIKGSANVGFVGAGARTDRALFELQRVSNDQATNVVRVGETSRPTAHDAKRHQQLIDLGGPEHGQWFDRALGICDEVVLLVPYNHYRPAALRKIIDEVLTRGSEVSIAVIIPAPRASRRLPISKGKELAGA